MENIRRALEESMPSRAVCVIAHSRKVQKLFDSMHISWAVQYEIARGVSLGWWTWDKITEDKLRHLQDPTNSAAAHVSQQIRGHPASAATPMDIAIW